MGGFAEEAVESSNALKCNDSLQNDVISRVTGRRALHVKERASDLLGGKNPSKNHSVLDKKKPVVLCSKHKFLRSFWSKTMETNGLDAVLHTKAEGGRVVLVETMEGHSLFYMVIDNRYRGDPISTC